MNNLSKRLFKIPDTESPLEYNGMKVGDVICPYQAGYWKLTSITRRFCSQQYYDSYERHKQQYDATKLRVGDEYGPVFVYKKIDIKKGILTSTVSQCDAEYCRLAIPEIEKEIAEKNRVLELLKTF